MPIPSVPSVTTKVSKTKQREIRKAAREEKESTERLLIQQRQIAAEIIRSKHIFRAIAEEAATKAIIVYARIESDKEVERIRKEKAEKAERKRVQRRKDDEEKLKKDKTRYFARLDEYLNVLPKDIKKEHEGYCSCDKCNYLPNRDYILGIDIEHTIYIFLLPESFSSYSSKDINLVTFAINRKYNIFNLKCYIKGIQQLKSYIHYEDKYRIIGLDEKSGEVKPFDTYLNSDFWSEINRSFIYPLKDIISKYYNYHNQLITFQNVFYSTFSTNQDTDYCSHEKQKSYEYSCPYDNDCPTIPQKRYIFEPNTDTFGIAFIPFQTANYCCANSKKNCVLSFDISYEDCKIGITIGRNRYDSKFYTINDLNKINFGEIEGGLFKSETMCKSCEAELKKQNAIEEVSTIFEMNNDEFTCTSARKFLSMKSQKLVGETIYPIYLLTGNCPNICNHNLSYRYRYQSSDDEMCRNCYLVENIYDSGEVLQFICEEFSIYKIQEQLIDEEISDQIAPNYLFELNSFSQKDIEMMYLYSICLGILPVEIIEFIWQFLIVNRNTSFNVSNKKLIQLDSLEDESPNLTLAKTSLKEQKYLMKLHASVKSFYKF